MNGQYHHVHTEINRYAHAQKTLHFVFVISFVQLAIICTYHNIWEAAVGQMLLCQKETSNPHVHITYAVLVTKGSNLLLRPFYVL